MAEREDDRPCATISRFPMPATQIRKLRRAKPVEEEQVEREIVAKHHTPSSIQREHLPTPLPQQHAFVLGFSCSRIAEMVVWKLHGQSLGPVR